MKEQDYINVSNLADIRSALAVLRNVIPESSKVITPKEFYAITARLYKLTDKLENKIKVK